MNQFSRSVSSFHGRLMPEPGCSLAGYGALIETLNLCVSIPEKCAVISPRHRRYATDCWEVYTTRHRPKDTLVGHLIFALKFEGVDLAILKGLFALINPEEILDWVKLEPTGRYCRRIWFFYEWLTEKQLDLLDAKTGNFVDALDPKQQYPGSSQFSRRHRVRNNLPGVRDFCPLVRCTEKLNTYVDCQLHLVINEKIKNTRRDLLARASAFLLLKDSRASFQIEQEQPEHGRAERWGQAIGQAGLQPLSKESLLCLQSIVLENNRFITLGFRQEGGFIGAHHRSTGAPMPDHISARWEDIDRLLDGMITTYQNLKKGPIDPIVLAAIIAFGFVFIHPFVDGNGRIHRYLVHHVLAESGFVPRGIVFPISAIILERIDEYKQVLESYSSSRLECIKWHPTDRGNIEVLNKTIDLYRYFDATKQAEFLYDCIDQAIKQSLPEELDYLERYDRMKQDVKELCAMPDHLVSLLIRFMEQNQGILSKRAQSNEFKSLSLDECQQLEALYAKHFKNEK